MDDYFYETSNLDSLHFLKTMMEMRLIRCAAVCSQDYSRFHGKDCYEMISTSERELLLALMAEEPTVPTL